MSDKGNYKISLFQYCVLMFIVSQALFEGAGFVILLNKLGHQLFPSLFLGGVLAIPILFLLLYHINYEPDLNIFEKNKKLFGNIIGSILNIFVILISITILSTITSNLDAIAAIKYLPRTPYMLIGASFIFMAAYLVIKGVETTARTAEILLILMLLIDIIMVPSEIMMIKIDNIKPLLIENTSSILHGAFLFLAYFLTPISGLIIIPKNNIVNNKNFNKFFIITGIISIVNIIFVTFLIVGIVDIDILKDFRFTEFYISKLIQLGTFFQNMEQFLSFYWVISMFLYATVGMHFISQGANIFFNIKKKIVNSIILFCFSIALPFLSVFLFRSTTSDLKFMKDYYPIIISLPVLIITTITSIIIFINKRKNKTA